MKEGTLIGGTHVYVPSFFNPSDYKLTELETKVLLAQIPALRSIEELYLFQKGGRRNVEMCQAIEEVGKVSNNPRIKEFWYMNQIYGCVYDISGNKLKPPFTEKEWEEAIKLLPIDQQDKYRGYEAYFTNPELDPHDKKGRNVFVNITDKSDEEFKQWMGQQFDIFYQSLSDVEKSARLEIILRPETKFVMKRKGDAYHWMQKPWTKIYPELTKKAAESFWQAGILCAKQYPKYSGILKATGRGMLTNNFDLRDVLLSMNDSGLYTFGGLTEEYIGSGLGWSFVKKQAYDLVLGVRDQKLTEQISKTKSKVPIFIEQLPKDLRNDSISEVNMQAIVSAMLVGDSKHWGATMAARNWPNDRLLNDLFPVVFMHVKESNERAKYLIKPTAEILLPPDKVPDEKTLSEHVNMETILHEYGHSVGKQKIYDAALEEGKATACAIWNYRLVNENPKVVEQYSWTIPVSLIRRIRTGLDIKTKKITDAHAIGENSILDEMFASGAVKIFDEIFEVDPELVIKTASEYVVHAVELEVNGKQEAITEYLAPHTKANEGTFQMIEKLNKLKIPKSIFFDRGTIDELEARFNDYLKILTKN
jgi:hypothetical protein